MHGDLGKRHEFFQVGLKLWVDLKTFTTKEHQCCLLFIRFVFSVAMHWSRSMDAGVLKAAHHDGSRRLQIAFPYLHRVLQWQPCKPRAVGVLRGAWTELWAGSTISDAVSWKQFKVPVRREANFSKEGGLVNVQDLCTWAVWPWPLLSCLSLNGHLALNFQTVISAPWVLAVESKIFIAFAIGRADFYYWLVTGRVCFKTLACFPASGWNHWKKCSLYFQG